MKRNETLLSSRTIARFGTLVLCLFSASAFSETLREITVFESGEGGYHTYRIPVVLRAADGTVLAFAEGRKNNAADNGDIDIVLRRSTDEGRSWGPLILVAENGPHTAGNPSPILDCQNGRIVLLFNQNYAEDDQTDIQMGTGTGTRTGWVSFSDDHGLHWSQPVEITDQVKRADWRWLAFGPAHGIQLQRGEHAGRLLVGACQNGPGGNGAFGVFSDDGGQTWQRGTGVEAAGGICPSESVMVELVDGRVQMNSRNRGGHERPRAIAYSRDGGATFAQRGLAEELIDPRVQGSVLRVAAVDEGDDHNEILFSNPAHTNARRKMTVRRSLDETETWDCGKLIHRGPSAYSDLVRLKDGAAGVLYEHGYEKRYERIRFASWPAGWLADPTLAQFDFGEQAEAGEIRSNGGHGMTALVEGTPTSIRSDAPGSSGLAWQFDGSREFVRLPDCEHHLFDFENEDSFTLEAVFRTTAHAGDRVGALISKDKAAGTPSYWLRLQDGQVHFLVSDGDSASGTSGGENLSDGVWHHVAAVRDADRWELRLYVDGRLVDRSNDTTHDDLGNEKDLLIGAFNSSDNRQFQGEIDLVRISDAAVDEAEFFHHPESSPCPQVSLSMQAGPSKQK